MNARRARWRCGLRVAGRSARRAALLGAVLGALIGPFVWAGPAAAHGELIGTAPANGERLDRLPAEVRMRFSERVNLVHDAITLLDARGGRVDREPARLDGAGDVV